MRWIESLSNSLRSLFRRNTAEQELGSEMSFRSERQVEENIAAGMTPQEARRAALREFGGVEQVKEECRDARRANYLDNLLKDVRYGLRMLLKSPSFTFFAVAVVALGIAANSAIFTIADAVLLRPLPYRDSNRLVIVWEDASAYGFPKDTPAPGNYSDWKSRNQVFEDIAATSFGGSFNLTGEGLPEKLTGRSVTANLFSVLGVTPELGRDFRSDAGRSARRSAL
jgi:MacB-like periplasmic core domain